jgi:hypothetical protein
MSRVIAIAAVLFSAIPALAADGPAGSYRLTADFGGDSAFTALLSFANQNNQWSGQFLGGLDLDPQLKPTIRDVSVTGDRLRFAIVLAGNQRMTFDGKLPTGRGPIPGSLAAGNDLIPVTLEPSALAKFDRTELLKEIVANGAPGPLFYSATVELLRTASQNKAKPEDVKAWADRALKVAEPHGIRWQMAILLRLGQALIGQPLYTAFALDLVRRAERLIDPTDDVTIQLAVFDLLNRLVRQANDPAAIAAVQAKLDALEARDYQEYVAGSPLRPEVFAGRKAKSDRAVLVELFTSAEDPPSVAAALAFDALPRVYKPTEVVRLQYHLHLPDADPLATKASEARWTYYQGKPTGGTPLTVIGGRADPTGGGRADFAATKLKQYRNLIDLFLNLPAGAALQLSATRTDDKLAITAKVRNLVKIGEKMRLRIAVAESVVRYRGGNGLRYHQCVVRGFAGSPDGWPMTKPAMEQAATVDLTALRAGLNAELDEYQKKNEGLVFPERPLGLRKLLVVAFVQDDATREVLQAVQVEVP